MAAASDDAATKLMNWRSHGPWRANEKLKRRFKTKLKHIDSKIAAATAVRTGVRAAKSTVRTARFTTVPSSPTNKNCISCVHTPYLKMERRRRSFKYKSCCFKVSLLSPKRRSSKWLGT